MYTGVGVGGYRLSGTDLKRTHGLSSEDSARVPPLLNNTSPRRMSTIRKISSAEGLTEDEQDRIAAILVSLLL